MERETGVVLQLGRSRETAERLKGRQEPAAQRMDFN